MAVFDKYFCYCPLDNCFGHQRSEGRREDQSYGQTRIRQFISSVTDIRTDRQHTQDLMFPPLARVGWDRSLWRCCLRPFLSPLGTGQTRVGKQPGT